MGLPAEAGSLLTPAGPLAGCANLSWACPKVLGWAMRRRGGGASSAWTMLGASAVTIDLRISVFPLQA